jgi:uncharacterized repeat protein (TIGR03803 family)
MRKFFGYFAALISALALSATSSSAQIFSPLHTFATATGSTAPLVQGPDGTLYGVSARGGVSAPTGSGTVFRLQPDGTGFSILYSFTNGSDGALPMAGLILSGGTLYGTTENGGSGAHGTVFKINTDGSGFATIHSFTAYTSGTNSDGASPLGRLVLSGNTLYGTTSAGGSHNSYGTIFKVNNDGTSFTTLYTFGLVGAGDPGFPMAGLVLSGSTLYGTTYTGGVTGAGGTVFQIDTGGTGFAVVHAFSAIVSGTNSDGTHPKAGLVLSGGILYGTTSAGGQGHGSVFSLNPGDSSFTNLYNFTNGVDGSTPIADLAISGGTLYGTTSAGGTNFPGWGTIFKLNTDGTGFGNLYEFAQNKNGTQPAAGLLVSDSTLYGTTPNTGGAIGGTVFRLGMDGSGFTVLANGNDGAQPLGGLVLLGDSFYGTTSAGGVAGEGVVFKVGTNGTGFTTLHAFPLATYDPASGGNYYTNSDGAIPVGTLASSGGVLYGTTELGGTFGGGTVFRVNTDGTGFTNLYSFTNGPGGAEPQAGVVISGNALYGTASGNFNIGTIFKINTDGTGFTNLYAFSALVNGTNNDGNGPLSGLVLGGDTLYGAAHYGGTDGAGTLYKIGTNGANFTVLFDFIAPTNSTDTLNMNGVNPVGGLILSGNTLYGTASGGSSGRKGSGSGNTPATIFKINTDGSGFTRLHSFTNIFDGSNPKAGLALSGSTLYGTASGGGNGGAGTVFQLDTNGTGFTTLHTFPFQQGTPMGDLVAIGNTAYGTSEYGAPVSASSLTGAGSVFAITPTAPPSIQFTASPTNGIPPQAVQFSAPGVDDRGNTLLAWYWNFGDGTPTFTITYSTNRSSGVISTNYNYISTQNPLHTYSNNVTYIPTLVAMNNNGVEVNGFGPAIVLAYPSSILNGGFEAGTFTNWTRTGNSGSSDISTLAPYRHSGTYGAHLAAAGTLGYLSQTLTTIPGSTYLVSLWLDSTNVSSANEFSVTWGGNVLMDQTNIPKIGWTNIQFFVTATGNITVLQLGYRNDSTYFGLDDVIVVSAQPVIAKLTFSGTNLVLNGSGGISNRTYYVLSSTNPATPLNQWIPLATNVLGSNGIFSITATNGVDPAAPRQFYILQMN